MTTVLVIGDDPAARRLVERIRHHGGPSLVRRLGAAADPDDPAPGCVDREVTLPAQEPGSEPRARVVRINRRQRTVRTADGADHPYDRVVLATGGDAVIPRVAGVLGRGGRLRSGVHVRRAAGDPVPDTDEAVVLGGGLLDMQAALILSRAGCRVHLVHGGQALLRRWIHPAGAIAVRAILEAAGVSVADRRVVRYDPGRVVLDDGTILPAPALVLGAGTRPRTGLARDAGLAVDGGVLVDDRLRTSDLRIHAVGDCATHPDTPVPDAQSTWEQVEVMARRLAGQRISYPGTRTVLRLAEEELDLASIGSPFADGELISVSDPPRGRYARLVVHDGRLLGASLVGLPEATAALSQLYDGDLPLPSALAAMLLGVAPETWSVPGTSPDDVICACNGVTRGRLMAAWRSGARDVVALARTTRASTGCGGCAGDLVRTAGAGQEAA